MNHPRLNGPRPGWVARIATGVTGALAVAGLLVVGLVAWVLLAGIFFVGAVALSIWYWRQKRHLQRFRRENPAGAQIIEVEYEVLHEEETRR